MHKVIYNMTIHIPSKCHALGRQVPIVPGIMPVSIIILIPEPASLPS